MIEELEIILETTSKILQKHGLRQNIVSENIDTPIIVAKITLKKSKGITIVDLATCNPFIVKN